MGRFDHLSEKLEDGAARLADDTAGFQILGAKDIIDDIGAATLVTQDLTAIAFRQAHLAFQDYATLVLNDKDPAGALLQWAGRRIQHQSEGMLEALRAINSESARLDAAHDAMWEGYRKVL